MPSSGDTNSSDWEDESEMIITNSSETGTTLESSQPLSPTETSTDWKEMEETEGGPIKRSSITPEETPKRRKRRKPDKGLDPTLALERKDHRQDVKAKPALALSCRRFEESAFLNDQITATSPEGG
ncbi:hypothetical protein BLNAU_2536 [Blattamonas nauphoetae]|uniref:Uncharacterized protein n=1 Tax=Blattamonas nauphoetae TaxID=2049346 RepID=A0ABQ9YEW1_9EUKA|nr:hypothetical protein BLNAU_2536 [Blattamonas nauphoetae]